MKYRYLRRINELKIRKILFNPFAEQKQFHKECNYLNAKNILIESFCDSGYYRKKYLF